MHAPLMALPASSVISPPQVIFSENKPFQLHKYTSLRNCLQLYPRFFKETREAGFRKRLVIKMQSSIGAQQLWEVAPEPVKEFPWRKAGDVLLQRLLVVGQATLKWSLVTLFVCSSLSDVIFSIFRNCELLIPVGLVIGCLLADFLKETLLVLFPNSEQGQGWNVLLVVISCLFVFVKAASAFLATPTRVLLLNVANGGFLQVLWIWRNLLAENDVQNPPLISGSEQ